MRNSRSILTVLALLPLLLLSLLAWFLLRRIADNQVAAFSTVEVNEASPTEMKPAAILTIGTALPETSAATLAPPVISSPIVTADATPSPAPEPTHEATIRVSPGPTLTATATPPWSITATSLAQADDADRRCPDPAPAKPDYFHYYLSGDKWPEANVGAGEHFWLSKPLPGGGRFLITDWLPYGYDAGGRYLLHNGVDAAEPQGTPLLAAADGLVVVAGEDKNALYGWRCNWYGNLVVIELDEKWQDQPVYTLYGHVQNVQVQPGQRVSQGQPIAEVGVGGAASLPHLHFEVRVGSNDFASTRNPLLWVEPANSRGVVAGRLVDPEGRPWQGVAVNVVGRSEGAEGTTTWTYLSDPQPMVNPDEGLAENFVVGDLKPGQYELFTSLQGQEYRASVVVEAGRLSIVELITEAFRTPTPETQSSTPGAAEG